MPTITAISPTSANLGASVTVTGTNFSATAGNNTVYFGATKATVTAASTTSLTVTVPTSATFGPISVQVANLTAFSTQFFLPTFAGAGSTIDASNLAAKVDFTTGTGPNGVAIGDVDGDGKPDLTVTNYGGSSGTTVSVYRNTSSSGTINTSSFAAKVDFTTGTGPFSVAIGDVDGDGKPDLTVVNYGSNTVSVFRNTSTSGTIDASSFAAKVDFTTGSNPLSVAVGDVDGDGKPDIAVANDGTATVSVFRNTSTSGTIDASSFAAKVDFTTGTNPRGVAIGDVDGDGKPDLTVSNFTSSTVSVFRNTSTSGTIDASSFAAKVDFTTGTNPRGVAIGDVDGDGKLDVAVANDGSGTVSVFRNTSTSGVIDASSLAAKVDFTTGTAPFSVAVGDVDGDGKPDLTVANFTSGTVSVFRNTSTSGVINASSFAARVDFTAGTNPRTVAIGDVDGDGKPDLTVSNDGSNTVSVFRNQTLTTALPTITSISPTSAAAGASVTITGTNFSATAANNTVFFDPIKATVTAASTTSLTVTVPNGAGYGPISVTVANRTAFSKQFFLPTPGPVFTGTGSTIDASNLAAKVDFTTGTGPFRVAMGDLDLDGKPDLTVTNETSNTVSVYRNTSSSGVINASSFAAKVDFTAGANPTSVAVGDVDGDGKPDLVVTNQGSSTVSVYRNTSSSGVIDASSFAAKVDFTTGSNPESVAIGDVDGDGKLDLIVTNQGSSTVSVYRNTSSSGVIDASSFAAKVDFTTGTVPRGVAMGDVDGDGKLDLAVVNYNSTTVSVYRNTSSSGTINSSSFAAKVDFTTGTNSTSVTMGDLDGDGKPDLTVTNETSNTVSVYRNTSSSGVIDASSFAAKVDFTTGTAPRGVAMGDVDGDGKLDLAVVNRDANTVSVYRNTSSSGTINSSSFAAKVDFTVGGGSRDVAIGDVDGDGKPDIAVGNFSSNTVSVLRNQTLTTALPTITSFTPTSAAAGASVTINGTNFSATAANNTVFFDPVRATVTAASTTSLTVTVPNGAGYGPISVTVQNRTAISTQFFLPTFAATVPGIDPTSLAAKVDFTTGTGPQHVAVGDLDGDGKPDLAVANNGSNTGTTVSVYRNTSTSGTIDAATFAAKVDFATGTGPRDVEIGDVDGDGKPDLVISNAATGTNTVSVLRNTSTSGTIDASSFAAKVDFTTGAGAYSVGIGDLDGDGKLDLAVSDNGEAKVSVLRNTSTPGTIDASSFAAKVDFTTGVNPRSVAIGDVDGDGKLDLSVANNGSNTVSVLRNTSAPGTIDASSFAAKVDFATGTGPLHVEIGDVDGDGKLDLAVANYGAGSGTTVSVYRNTSTSGTISLAASVDFTTGTGPRSVGIGDVDGDGKPELAVPNDGSNTVSVYRNTSTSGTIDASSFAAKEDFTTGTSPYGVAIGDVDGDNKPDLVVTDNVGAKMSVLRNQTYTAPLPTITSFTPTSAAAGASVTITGTNFSATAGNNTVFFGATKATVTAASATSLTATVPTGATFGPLSVQVANRTAISKAFFLPTFASTVPGIDPTTLAAKVDFTTGSVPYRGALGDVDGDGKPDLAVTNYGSGSGTTVSVYRNTSTSGTVDASSFAAKVDFTTGTGPIGLALGDVDGDGKLDLAVTNRGANTVSVYRNTSTSGTIDASSFDAKVDFTAGTAPNNVALRDVDGDGKLDLIVPNYNSASVSVYRNTSTLGTIDASSFAAKVDFTTGTGPYDVAVGDVDGDGKPDLALPNATSNTVSVFRNTSTPGVINSSSFAAKVDFTAGGNPYNVALGDVDGDGKPDLAVSNNSSGTVSVFRNTSTSGTIDASSFAAKVDFTTGGSPRGVVVGDVDGDGKPDLAVASGTATLSVFRNQTLTTALPTITSFTPTSAAAGASVTITGTNFSATAGNNTVFFDPIKATVTSASSTSLTVTVPNGAGYGPISVTVGNRTAISTQFFLPTFTATVPGIDPTTLAAKVDFTSGTSPLGMAMGDVDGDGKSDLVAANGNSNTVSIYRNTSTSGTVDASSFSAKVDFITGTFPYGMATGDLDGDGKPELVVANYSSATVSVFRNTSNSGLINSSSFAAKVDFTTGTNPYSVAIGDLDGDGKAELAVANYSSNTVSVFRNTSSSGTIDASSFAAKVDLTTGTNPSGVAIGDLDGDGKLDIAVENRNSNTVSVFRNTSSSGSITSSSFAAKVDFTTGTNPYSVVIGDLDGDGKLDLAVANNTSATLSVFRNTSTSGSVTFDAKVDFTTGSGPYGVAVGDVDGDGKPDLAVANYGSGGTTVSLFKNTSTAGVINSSSLAAKVDYTTGNDPTSVAIGDLDGDGKPDLVVTNQASNSVSVFRNLTLTTPLPTITSISPTSAAAGASVTITGTNFSATAGNNTVFFDPVRATVTSASSTSLTVTVPNGAGYGPISVTVANRTAISKQFFLPTFASATAPGIGSNSLAAKVDFATGTGGNRVVIGDVDGDGKPELTVANYGNGSGTTVSVFRNTSTSGTIDASTLAAKVDFTAGTGPLGLALGDVDGDGKPDLAVANSGSNTVSVYRNTSTSGAIDGSSFAAKVDFATGTTPQGVALGDADGDGKPDLAVANSGSNTVSVYRNTSTAGVIDASSFSAKVDFTAGTTPHSVAIGDVDGDGKLELVVANNGSNTVSVFRNTSSSGVINSGSLAAKVDFATGTTPQGVVFGDVDGDGKLELAVANHGSSSNGTTVSVLRNTSTSGAIDASSFSAKVDFTTGTGPWEVALGDLGGGGKPDLIVSNYSSNTVSVLRNTSTSGAIDASSFSAKVDFATGSVPRGVAVGDVDGDGKPDLAVANSTSNTLSVLRNLDPLLLEVGAAAGVDDPNTGTGVAWGDFDNDGDQDLYLANEGQANKLYRNNNNDTFTEVGSAAGVNDAGNGEGIAWGDYDNDGDLDLYLANSGSANKLYSNNGNSTFTDIGASAGVDDGNLSKGVGWGDYDGDGDLDLYLANFNTVNKLYRNNGNNTFTDIGNTAGVDDGGQGYGVAWGDYDTDGDLDLYLVNSGSADRLYRNNGNSTFTEVGGTAGTNTGGNGRGGAWGDYDNDGDLDLYLSTSIGNANLLYRNNNNGTFTEVGAAAGVNDIGQGQGVAWGDYDNDGDLDLYEANSSSEANRLYRNNGNGTFTEVGASNGVADTGNGSGAAWGDYDNDGDLDLYLANVGSANRLFKNNGNTNRWLQVKLAGTISNKNGIGARVAATAGATTQRREVDGGSGVFSQPSLPVEFGFGSTNTVDQLQITWPSGLVQTQTNVATNQVLSITEQLLTITSFTPTSAVAGTPVTITGTSFSATPASNTVYFGATKATVTAASTTSLTVTVPTGATFGPLSVTVWNRTAISKQFFLPTFTGTGSTIDASNLAAKVDFTTGTGPNRVAMGDVDGDGKSDLVVSNYENGSGTTVSVYRNTSASGAIDASSFAAKVDFTTGTGPLGVAIGDVDGDGKPDLAVTNNGGGGSGTTVSVFRNTSTSGAIDASSFAAKVDFTSGAGPLGVAVEDVDGDGKPDLAVTNNGGGSGTTVSVLRNTSTLGVIDASSFAAKVDFTTGTAPNGVAVGDVDGSGKPELTVANSGSNTVSVFRNTSSAGVIDASSFAAKVDFTTGTRPNGVAIGDVDGDGKLELMVTNHGSSSDGTTVSVFRNTSTSGAIDASSFAAKVDFTTGTGPWAVAIGDVDGSGKPDLAVSNYSSNTVSVLRNTSTSGAIDATSFAAKVDFTTGSVPRGLAVGDVDGDGKPDIAVLNSSSNTVSVLRNQTLTAPLPTITSITPISAAAGASVTITGTNFSATAANNTVFFDPVRATVTSASSTSLTVTVPNGAGYGPISVTVANRTAISKQFFLPTFAGTVPGIDPTTLAAKVDFATGATPTPVAIGDLDGDGKVDLVATNSDGGTGTTLSVLRNTSTSGAIDASSFAAKEDFTTGTRPSGVVIRDLDGDGKSDLAVANRTSNTISLLRNTGAPGTIAFAAKVDFATGTGPLGLAVDDLDGDGKPDLVVANYTNNTGTTMSVFRNTSTPGAITSSSFAGKVDFTTGASPVGIAIGDLDGDGKPDIVVTNAASSTVSVFRNTSTPGAITSSSFAGKVDFTAGTTPQGLVICDLDGDGKFDMATSNIGSTSVSVFRNTSASGAIDGSSFAAKVDFATASGPRLDVGDLDGDGKPDLAVTNNSGGTGTVVSLFRNTSSSGVIDASSFAAKLDFSTGTGPGGVAIGDLDGDGKPDLAVSNTVSNTVSVLRNQTLTETTLAAGLSGAATVAPGGEVVIFRIGLTGDGVNTVSSATLTIADLSVPTGLVASDFAQLRWYLSTDALLDGGDIQIGTQPVIALGSPVTITAVSPSPDLDKNGVADAADAFFFFTHFALDLNNSGTVNFDDFFLFADRAGQVAPDVPRRDVQRFYFVTAVMSTAVTDKHAFRVGFAANGVTTSIGGRGSAVAASDANKVTVEVAATQLVFTTQPGGAVHGQLLATQPVVQARDANGNVDRDFAGIVTLSPGAGGTLTGTATIPALNGVATFSGLGFSGAGTRTLMAAAGGLSTGASAPFAVAKAPASIAFTSLDVPFNGQPRAAGISTSPAGLPVGTTYNGSGNPPVGPGRFFVVATINNPDYEGSASANFTIFAPPVARLNASATQGNPPLEVNFTDASSGAIDAWYLETFDSAGRTSENRGGIRAVYERPGIYEAVLTVRGPGGQSVSRIGITVFRPPQVGNINPPTAPEDAVLEFSLAGLDPEPGGWAVRGTDPALVAKAEVQGDLLRFTPVPDAAGTDEVEIVRTGLSGLALVKPVVLRWLPQDDPPLILPALPGVYQADEDQPIQVGGAGFAQDVDTDPGTLVWSASGYDARLVASAAGGSGGVRLAPVPDANGQTKAQLKLRDPATGAEASREISLNWNPVPDPPQVPVALFPPNNAGEVPLSPVLAWAAQDVDVEPLRYTLFLAPAGQGPVQLGGDLGQAQYSLPPLRPSTSYTWRVVARDPTGSSAEASFSFTTQADRQAPSLSSLRVAPAEESANLSWNTSELARGSVRALPEAGGEALSARGEALTDQHHLVLSGLQPASWYRFEVNATDEAGNLSATLRGRLLTLAAADKQPPLLLVAPFVEGLTDQSAVIRWTTDELATGLVRYVAAGALGGQQTSAELVKDQQVRLSNLLPATAYTYEVQSTDASGNLSALRQGSFTTAAAADLAPPRFVEGPGVQSASDKEALVVLKTDELSRAELRYDLDQDLRDGRLETSRSGTAHQFQLSGLEPGKPYFYQVLIADESGNQSVSSQRSFQARNAPDLRPAQLLEGPAIEGVSETGGVLVLRADEPVALQVLLSASADLGAPSLVESPQLQPRHSLTLSNLLPDTPYFYQVQAADAAGNQTPPVQGQFRTARERDTVPPRFVEGPVVEGVGAESASLAWRTDELATGTVRVEEETGTEAARELALPVPASEQRVQLTQLTPDTRYRAVVTVQDAQGNPTLVRLSFKTRKIADLLPPRLTSGPSVQGLNAAGAAIALGCDEPVEVVLRYGTAPGLQGAEVVSTGERRREHWIELRGLSAGTTYYGSVEVSDAAGNTAEARSFSFTTPAQQDLDPAVFIAGPAALAITQQGARVEWALDEPASGEVEIGIGEGLAGARQIGVLERRQHQGVEVGGLEANTTYGYRVRAVDASGNEARSPVRAFKTLGLQPLGPPVFTAGPAAPQVSQDQATLFWRTDQPADAKVEYFQSGDPGEVLEENRGRLETEHTVVLTNLAAGAEYGYRISSRNAQGTSSETRSGTFRMREVKDEKPPVLLGPPAVLSLQQDRARIGWRTDELADSQVRFRDPQGGSGQVGDPGATVDHVLDLTNLKPGTTYRFQVASTDQAGNGPTQSGEETFTTPMEADQAPPQYTRWPAIKTRTANALLLSWATSELSTAIVQYGKTDQYELGSQSQLEPAVEHEWHLGQLEPGQTYYLRVGAEDLAGNGPAYAPGLVVSTLAAADATPPQILTGPIVVQTTAASAVIEWGTDEVSDGVVDFSGAGLSEVAVDPEFRRNHQLVLTNLSPGQTYQYTVASRDVAGNGPTRSVPGEFTTDAAGQTPAPQITGGPTALEVGPTTATFVWHTDVPANTTLDYGPTTAYGQKVQQGELTQEHTVSLVGLIPGTTYHFKASSAALGGGLVSTDPAGNTLYSLDHQFTTPQQLDQEAPQLIRAPMVEWTDRTAVVSWTTDELSGSRVDWAWIDSKGQKQGDFIADNELVRDHSLTLTQLKKRSSYRFQVTSVDGAGNAMIWGTLVEAAKAAPGNRAAKILQPPGGAGSFVTDNLPDTQPPVIVEGPRIREKTTQTLTVEWETDELADSFVRFGSTGELGAEVGQARDETVHQITLTNLKPGQKYYFKVASTDPSGNGATESGVALSSTAAEVDLSPPRFLEEPRVLAAADDEAVLAWRTDEAASARVEYWVQGGEVLTRRTIERVADPRLALTNLKPDTEYLARVFVTDASQNEARAAVDLRLRTDRLPDLSPPQLVGEPVVSELSDRGAAIEWTTDELASSAVDYDLTPYLGAVAGDPEYTTNHRVVLTGLQPGQTYYFRAGSIDLAGNGPVHSEVVSFTTLSAADNQAPEAPTGLLVRSGSRILLVSWEANGESDLAGYNLYRAEEGKFALIASALSGTSYLDEGLIEGHTYRYQLRAQDRQGNLGEPGEIAEGVLVLEAIAPRVLGLEQGAAPGLPVLLFQGPDQAEAGLSYTAQVSSRDDFGDVVDRGGNIPEGLGGLTRWRVSRALDPDQGYWWRVRAFDGFFEGAWSEPLQLVPAQAEKPALTEDFDGDGMVGFGDFFLFADGFGGNDPTLDLDGDGMVGFGDFFLFADRFGQSIPTKPRWAQQAQVADGTALEVEAMALSAQEVVLSLRLEGVASLTGYGLALEFDPPVLHYVASDSASGPGDNLRLIRQFEGQLLLAEHLPGRQQGVPATQLLGAPLHFRVAPGRLPALRVRVSEGAISTGRGRGWRVAQNGQARIVPQLYALLPNYPNPFNPATTLSVALPTAGEGRLEICNLLGQTLRRWDLGSLEPGYHALVWDGLDQEGRPAASGVYLARLRVGSFAQTRKLLLVR